MGFLSPDRDSYVNLIAEASDHHHRCDSLDKPRTLDWDAHDEEIVLLEVNDHRGMRQSPAAGHEKSPQKLHRLRPGHQEVGDQVVRVPFHLKIPGVLVSFEL